jgi:hypothetical protein
MKLKVLLIFACFAISAMAANAADIQLSNTGFSSFHVEGPTGSDPYTCINEDNGAVVNNCSYVVSLEFSLPIYSAGSKTITIKDGWFGTDGEETFGCTSYAYSGTNSNGTVGTTANFTAPAQSITTTVTAASGDNIQVICYNVPTLGGVASLQWNL